MITSETARVVVERILPGTPVEVFAAWLDRDTLREFIGPGDASTADVEIDPRVGGGFRITMWVDGRAVEHVGEYRVIAAPRRLVFTWQSPATDNRPTLVTIELTPHEDGTRLVLVHEQLPSDYAARRHEKGWSVRVDKLAALLWPDVGDSPARRTAGGVGFPAGCPGHAIGRASASNVLFSRRESAHFPLSRSERSTLVPRVDNLLPVG